MLQIFGIENTSRCKNGQNNFNCQKFEKKVKLLKKKEKEGRIPAGKRRTNFSKEGKIWKNNEKEGKRRTKVKKKEKEGRWTRENVD